MAEVVNGQYRIKDEPPLIVHVEALDEVKQAGEDIEHVKELENEAVKRAFEAYMETLPDDRKVLLNRYHFVDFARKVDGVGSVGTRAWVWTTYWELSWDAVPGAVDYLIYYATSESISSKPRRTEKLCCWLSVARGVGAVFQQDELG